MSSSAVAVTNSFWAVDNSGTLTDVISGKALSTVKTISSGADITFPLESLAIIDAVCSPSDRGSVTVYVNALADLL